MNAYLAKARSYVFPELREVYETVDVSVAVVLKIKGLNQGIYSESR
jgi:hypothetical protein